MFKTKFLHTFPYFLYAFRKPGLSPFCVNLSRFSFPLMIWQFMYNLHRFDKNLKFRDPFSQFCNPRIISCFITPGALESDHELVCVTLWNSVPTILNWPEIFPIREHYLFLCIYDLCSYVSMFMIILSCIICRVFFDPFPP